MKQEDLTPNGLLEMMTNAEREIAAGANQTPIYEWEVTKIKPEFGTQLTSQVLLANSEEAKEALQVRLKKCRSNIMQIEF